MNHDLDSIILAADLADDLADELDWDEMAFTAADFADASDPSGMANLDRQLSAIVSRMAR